MDIKTDSSGQKFIEAPMLGDEKVRVTLIEDSWADTPGVRIQVRQAGGHLMQGPEIPATAIGQVVAAVVELVRQR